MNFWKGLGIFLLVVVLIIGMTVGGWAWRYYTAEPKGIVDAEEQIQSGANRIDKYNKFFDLCASVQRQKRSLEAQESILESSPDNEKSRIRQNIAGLQAQVQGTVSRYNSLSTRGYTAGQFRASNLPYKLSVEGDTTCAR